MNIGPQKLTKNTLFLSYIRLNEFCKWSGIIYLLLAAVMMFWKYVDHIRVEWLNCREIDYPGYPIKGYYSPLSALLQFLLRARSCRDY